MTRRVWTASLARGAHFLRRTAVLGLALLLALGGAGVAAAKKKKEEDRRQYTVTESFSKKFNAAREHLLEERYDAARELVISLERKGDRLNPHERALVYQTLGHIEGGQEYLLRSKPQLDPRARRHRDLVYELMRKGLLLPVPDADNLSFSNVVVARRHHPLVDQARREGRRVGTPHGRPLGPLRSGLLGVSQTVLSTPPDYLPSYAYGVCRFCDTMCPPTPYGYLRFVPDCAEARAFLRGKQPVETDGCDVFLDGKRVSAGSARPILLAQLRAAAQKLAFRADGASLYVHRIGEAWRVWLLDPGYLCPAGVRTDLQIRAPGQRFVASDLVAGKAIPVEGRRMPLTVPAGGFRVVEVRTAR